eukprot:IDg22978t1
MVLRFLDNDMSMNQDAEKFEINWMQAYHIHESILQLQAAFDNGNSPTTLKYGKQS